MRARGAGADRDGDLQEFVGGGLVAAALLAFIARLWAAGRAHRHAVALDRGAQRLEVRQDLPQIGAGEKQAELLAAVAEGLAAAADLREARADELQHLVADVVAVG